MNWKKWFKGQTNLHTINKKIFLISKIIALFIIVILFISSSWNINSIGNILLMLLFISGFMIILDLILYRIVAVPIQSLERSAMKMAQLDFSEYCDVNTYDEYGSLAKNLNIMSDNLQSTLSELEIANQRLRADVKREQELLSERKELVDVLSHEMKTPLGVISAYAEGIRDSDDEEVRSKYLDTIIQSANEMSEQINLLLDLSSMESGITQFNYSEVDFVELVETVAGRLLMDVGSSKYLFDYELPKEAVMLNLDVKRMEQVLSNLVLNAVNYVIDHGRIELSVVLSGDGVRFSIYNDCEYIEESELGKIWDKFYRRSDERSGSGLGLAIVAQILEMQNIEYGVNSIRQGVEFYFILPIEKTL